jgi:hypothetical protein
MLEQNEVTIGLAGQYVDTYVFVDGRLDVRWKGVSLPYRMFDKDQRVAPAAIVENKRLREVLAFIKSQQDQRAPPRLMTKSERMGYQKTGRQPRGGRRIIEKVIEQRRAAAASTARPAK